MTGNRHPGASNTSIPMILWFGKHRGQCLSTVPVGYLQWLQGIDMKPHQKRAIKAELKRRRSQPEKRQQAIAAEPPYMTPGRVGQILAHLDNLPDGEPQEVYGIELRGWEVARLDEAIRTGELILTPDIPVASQLPNAWQVFCEKNGLPHNVQTITMDEIMQSTRSLQGAD